MVQKIPEINPGIYFVFYGLFCVSFCESVRRFGDTLKLRLALEIEENRRLFYLTALEDAFDDLVTMERLASFLEDLGDDVRDGSLAVAPAVKRVDTAADEDEALIFDELIVNRLGRDIFSFEVAILDELGDF